MKSVMNRTQFVAVGWQELTVAGQQGLKLAHLLQPAARKLRLGQAWLGGNLGMLQADSGT